MPSRFHLALLASILLCLPKTAHAQEPAATTVSPPTTQQDPAVHTAQELRDHGTLPQVVRQIQPHFSIEARRKKINGEVLVSLVVDEHGMPTNLKVIHSLGYGLDEKALEAVSKYRFKPATYEGQVISVPLTLALDFRIYR
jgi:TonB family protein